MPKLSSHLHRLADSLRMTHQLQRAHYRQKLNRRYARQAAFCLAVLFLLLTLLR